jgi:RNA polymerase sigma factor (sigma-70 family)
MGASDAEGAVQEALRRSFENPLSRAAIEYYLDETPPSDRSPAPQWSFAQLLAWLHGVLRRVVLEEHARASYRREVLTPDSRSPEMSDPSPDALETLIDDQRTAIVRECLSSVAEGYRQVLTLRAEGLKYSEIAARLNVSENTVATWVHRATKLVAQQVRDRMYTLPQPAVAPGCEE